MDDLIARARKYAKSAGRTGEGQRSAAEKDERKERWLGWVSAALSAGVGTSIFAQLVNTNPIPFGAAAIIAAVLTAIQRTSKLAERAEAHRIAGAEYGQLRRRADMLLLRIEGGDVKRDAALKELETMGEDLSQLGKKVRLLPDAIYNAAKRKFDQAHQDDLKIPTHAGGVVFRRAGAGIEFLIVRAKGEPRDWVLPKGHIEHNESAEEAARREVREESGVQTTIRDNLGVIEFSTPNEHVRAKFFLMDVVLEGLPREGRERKWVSFDDAVQAIRFQEAQRLLCHAYVLLRDSLSLSQTASS